MSCVTILFKNLQISRSDIRPHIKWVVSLVILHMVNSIFLQSLCEYTCIWDITRISLLVCLSVTLSSLICLRNFSMTIGLISMKLGTDDLCNVCSCACMLFITVSTKIVKLSENVIPPRTNSNQLPVVYMFWHICGRSSGCWMSCPLSWHDLLHHANSQQIKVQNHRL